MYQMEKQSGLTKADVEMIVGAKSEENNRIDCVVAHGVVLRICTKNLLVADQLAANYRKAEITPRQMALLGFAAKVCDESWGS